jgi:hypothetical protein
MLQHLTILISSNRHSRESIRQGKRIKYLKYYAIIIVAARSVGPSPRRARSRSFTGTFGVRGAHLVRVSDLERIRVLVVLVSASGNVRFRLLGTDASKLLQYKE